MRDVKRIRKFCNRLAAAWELVPDLRLVQLFYIIFSQIEDDGKDIIPQPFQGQARILVFAYLSATSRSDSILSRPLEIPSSCSP